MLPKKQLILEHNKNDLMDILKPKVMTSPSNAEAFAFFGLNLSIQIHRFECPLSSKASLYWIKHNQTLSWPQQSLNKIRLH